MTRVFAVFDAPILLGRRGEHGIREVAFDLKDWINDYGEGYAQLAVHRHGEDDYYLVPLIREGRIAVWRVTAADVGVVGKGGECELSWLSNDGAFVKSDTWQTTVLEGMNGEEVEAPDTAKAWLDAAREQAAEAEENLDASREQAAAAERSRRNAEQAAGEAEKSAEAAAGRAKDAQLYAEGAKYSEALVRDAVDNPPKAINGTWWVWSIKDGGYVDTCISAVGPEGSAGADGYIPQKGIDYWTAEDIAEIDEHIDEKNEPLDQRTAALEKRFADMDYGDGIVISSFGHNAGTQEKGASVKSLTLSWSYQNNKQPTTQSINGNSLGVSVRSKYEDGLNITMDSKTWPTWTLEATDERSKVVRKTAPGFTFLNGVYCGVLEDGIVIDSAAILTLSRTLKSTKAITFSANPGSTQRIAYAIPSDYGAPKFSVGGFEGGFAKAASEFEFVNGSGYMEKYDVWLSDETGLGNTMVVVQ